MNDTTEPIKCPHESIQFDASAVLVEDSNIMFAVLAARCADCEKMFEFLGAPASKEPFTDRPSVDVDRVWMAIPMIPEGENTSRLIIN